MADSSTNRVVETVWPWKPGGPAPSAPSRPRWIQGLIQSAIMAAIGLFLHQVLGHHLMGYVVWSLAAVVLGSALFFPPAFAAIEGFGKKLGLWVGTGMTYLLLVPFFYIVFVPGRLFLALAGKDPMKRTFPAPEPSCWEPRRTKMDEAHYRKQFS